MNLVSVSRAQNYLKRLQESVYLAKNFSLEDIQPHLDEIIDSAIERVRKNIRESSPSMSPSEIEKYLTTMRKQMEEIKKIETPTPYENPSYYQIMMEYSKEIEKSLRRNISLKSSSNDSRFQNFSENINTIRPLFGTLPTGELNARAIAIPFSKDHLVIFETELFPFCGRISKFAACFIPVEGKKSGKLYFSLKEKHIKKTINDNEQIVQQFQEFIINYLINERIDRHSDFFITQTQEFLSNSLLHSMQLFILGHEYGHIVCKHLESSKISGSFLGEEEVKEIIHSHTEELEADIVGFMLMLGAMERRGFDQALSFWGADLFFSCLDIVERGRCILKNGSEEPYWKNLSNYEPTGSHPPTVFRRENLREWMEKRYGEHSIEPGKAIENIIENLWSSTIPSLLQYYNKGN